MAVRRPENRKGTLALEANQQCLRMALEAGGIGLLHWDLLTGKISWNENCGGLLGLRPGEFDGNYASFEDRIQRADVQGFKSAVETATKARTPFSYEFRVTWPDATVHWILLGGQFSYDESGRALRMCGAITGIDDRKRLEGALRAAEERFRTVLDHMVEGCKLIGFEWTLLYANEAAARYCLKDGENIVGRSVFEVHPGIEKSDAFAHYRRSMEERVPQRFEENIVSPGGVNRCYEVSVAPVPEGIFVLSLDITDRKQAERELRKSEERLRQAVRVSGTGIFDHDHSSEFVYWSPEQHAIYGTDPRDPVTIASYLGHVHPDDRERIAEAVRRAHDPEGDGSFDLEHRLVRPDGSVHWTSIRSQTFFEGEGKNRHPVRTVGAATDITDRKQEEAERAKLEARLFQAQKMESVGRLAGGVAHDFNNLLTVINGYTDLLLQRTNTKDASVPALQEIKKAGLKAAELTRQLLAFGREQVPVPKVLNLNDVIRDLENLLRRLIGEDIAFTTVLDPALGTVTADPGQISQVLMNLAANSRDAMPNGGRLEIRTENVELDEAYASEHPEATPGPYVQLTVTDSGLGMNSETRSHIFEPFFTTKKIGEGTGLGLATVYGAVTQAGGFIRVYSEPGRGATFRVYLPRVKQAIQMPEPEAPQPGQWKGTETILLVEDQPELRRLARTILESRGYFVLDAANAEDAMLRAEQWRGRIHLMLTDVVMPGLSGWDLAKRLKPLRPDMKVIYMSGYADTATLREIRDAGMDFLQKPLSPNTLADRVKEVLERE